MGVEEDPGFDVRRAFQEAGAPILGQGEHGLLGAHVGGGNPLIPLLADFVVVQKKLVVPKVVNRSYVGYDYGMLGNDRYGCCVFADLYHDIMHARKGVKRADVPVDSTQLTQCVLGSYSDVTGFTPDDPSTDRGTNPADAMQYWHDEGLLLPDGSRDKIDGAVQILPHDGANFRRGVYEFDAVHMSVSLPVAWQQAGNTWDVGGDPVNDPNWQPGGWGGHEVLGVSFDARVIAFVTWGGIKFMTWRAWGTYGSLGIVSLSKDEIGRTGVSETGLNYDVMTKDVVGL